MAQFQSAILRKSVYYYAPSDNTRQPGFNLDKWLRQQLINLAVIPSNASCCPQRQLYVKGGFVFRTTGTQGFSFNQYLRTILYRIGVTTNGTCCDDDFDIRVDPSMVVYIKNNLTGLPLINWIKDRLDFYGILYEDPCCPNITPPPATNRVVDDTANTFDWTNPTGYTTADMETTINSGGTWQPAVKPLNVGNVNKSVGTVGVRVKAVKGRNKSTAIYNTVPFTTS